MPNSSTCHNFSPARCRCHAPRPLSLSSSTSTSTSSSSSQSREVFPSRKCLPYKCIKHYRTAVPKTCNTNSGKMGGEGGTFYILNFCRPCFSPPRNENPKITPPYTIFFWPSFPDGPHRFLSRRDASDW